MYLREVPAYEGSDGSLLHYDDVSSDGGSGENEPIVLLAGGAARHPSYLGNLAGLGICLVQKYFHIIKLPQESYYLSYAPVELNWWWVLFLNLGTIAITLLLLIIPSMLVSRISPVKAIRFE